MPDRGSGGRVASLVAAAVSVYALPPTAADFAACNADAHVAVKAGTASPTTMDYVRVESARTDSAATWTTWVGPIRVESSDHLMVTLCGALGATSTPIPSFVWRMYLRLGITPIRSTPGLFEGVLPFGVLSATSARN